MEITSPTAELNSGYFSSEAYAGLGCDSCGNTNDTQIKLPSAIHLEKCSKLEMHSARQETRPTELLLISATNLRPAGNSACCYCNLAVFDAWAVESDVNPTGVFFVCQVVIILSSDWSVITYHIFPLHSDLAVAFSSKFSRTHCNLPHNSTLSLSS